MTLKSTLKSLRLRTLPLSLSGIVAGLALAFTVAEPQWALALSVALTATFLQILSNLSNELGDTLHGTDTDGRQGIRYSLQEGEMTITEMRRLIALMVFLCCASGLMMIFLSFGTLWALQPLLFVLLGASAIWAAMHYTLGKKPYGYRGLGDLFVFIFFGLVSTLGSAYVCAHCFRWYWLLVACAVGLFSIGVLNVNNIRDMKTDAATRTTVALKMGPRRSRIYQSALILVGWALLIYCTLLLGITLLRCLFFLTLPLFILHLVGVWKRKDRRLDPMLPLLVISTFVLSLLFALGLWLS